MDREQHGSPSGLERIASKRRALDRLAFLVSDVLPGICLIGRLRLLVHTVIQKAGMKVRFAQSLDAHQQATPAVAYADTGTMYGVPDEPQSRHFPSHLPQ